MKANELMIGDWVKFPGGTIDKIVDLPYVPGMRICARFAISASLYLSLPFSVDKIEPVLLTPEILEKNGFARDEIAGWRFRQYEDGLGLIYEIYWNNKGDNLEIVSNLAKNGGFDKKGIQFVHQLQHALRDCGIEKKIEL